jgi:hypothetical protein
MTVMNQIAELMQSYGYSLKRQAKHKIWINSKGQVIVTAKTPSDVRAIKNIKSLIYRQIGA